MSAVAVTWTTRILIGCCAVALARLIIGPRGADRLTALSVLSSMVLGILTLYGSQAGRSAYLDVALVYDIFGFLGILSISVFIKDRA